MVAARKDFQKRLAAVLQGKWDDVQVVENSTVVRIYVSSTGADVLAERAYLSEFVFPELHRRTAERGLALVVCDLRDVTAPGGPSDFAADPDHSAAEVALGELRRYMASTPGASGGPCFVHIGGSRYGARLLPRSLSAADFAALSALPELQGEHAAALAAAYELDSNQLPAPGTYLLKAREFFFV